MRIGHYLLGVVLVSSMAPVAVGGPAIVPPEFEDVAVVSNFNGVSQFGWAPDGLLFIASKAGDVRVWDGSTLTSVGALAVDNWFERGLNGLTIDPDYLTNGHIWIYYANSVSGRNQVSRFTYNGLQLVDEVVMLEGPVLLNGNHSAGGIRFASDKTLYIAMGDDGQGAVTAQDPHTLTGSILRINRDGSAPADNPFVDGVLGDPRVWAYGVRNPFRIAVQPETDNIFIADVGNTRWEEISIGVPGGNFGWPTIEGPEPPAQPGYIYPTYSYFHNFAGAAIIGGDFADVGDFAEEYEGDYFYGDFATRKMFRVVLDETNSVVQVEEFAQGLIAPSDIQFGPGGALYYISRYNPGESTGELRSISYISSGNRRPRAIASAAPDNGSAPLSTTLDGSASTDPEEDPLTYSWDLGDSTSSTDPSVSKSYPSGVYYAELTVDDGQGGTDGSGPIRIVSGNNRPTATVSMPPGGSNFVAGQTITYDSSVVDAEDASIPCSSMTWKVIFHHDNHTHPFLGPLAGQCTGNFVTADAGETSANTWYEIQLTATDSGDPIGPDAALSGTQSIEIFPLTSTMTFATAPRPDLELRLDGQPLAPPTDVPGVVDFKRSIEAIDEQTMGDGHTYRWSSWSQGGAILQTLSTPPVDTTFTANYVCDVIDAVQNLRLDRQSGTEDVDFSWTPVDSTCFSRYRIYGADTVTPAALPGEFPIDPAWTMIGTTVQTSFQSTGDGLSYFLVAGEGTDAAAGPVPHYGSNVCTDYDGDGFGNGVAGNSGCVVPTVDSDDSDPFACADVDLDGCDDCSNGGYDPANDGADSDGDGSCDVGDTCTDVDGDGLGDGNLGNTSCVNPTTDSDDGDATSCGDTDLDGCEDCTVGSFAPSADGADADSDGLCDLGDTCTDVDADGLGNGSFANASCAHPATDMNDNDPFLCRDTDNDSCDDCVSGTFAPSDDGPDGDNDGACDAGDNCPEHFNAGQADPDGDGLGNPCDHCNDADLDGLGRGNNGNDECINPTNDSDDGNRFVCADTDGDTCEDCVSGVWDPANDGQDIDGDGLCESP